MLNEPSLGESTAKKLVANLNTRPQLLTSIIIANRLQLIVFILRLMQRPCSEYFTRIEIMCDILSVSQVYKGACESVEWVRNDNCVEGYSDI